MGGVEEGIAFCCTVSNTNPVEAGNRMERLLQQGR
jgi:hypothetical protein